MQIIAPAPPPPAPPPPPPPEPNDVLTPEFLESPVLAHINADAAYRAGITGQGVVIASLEDGIDDEHPELINRIHPLSRAFGGDVSRGLKGPGEHGTRTGGIIAAAKNDIGTHGVAYNAQILILSVEDASDCAPDVYGVPKCTSFFEAIPEALDFAVAQAVKIVMVQRGAGSQEAIDAAGLTTEFNAIAAAYGRGIDAGVVFIGPAGNGPVGDPLTASPVFFPYLAIGRLEGTNNGIIAVGSVDENNNLWVWQSASGGLFQSHAAGEAAEYYLVAPSVAPYVKKDGTLTTNFRPGTSNSAPHVVGAAALLQEAFPNLTGREIAEILLESATDLGAPGTDPIFGRGLLNIEAALQPLGTTSVASVTGNSFAISGTVASFPAAFGDAFSSAARLDQVIMLDGFNRSFVFDLGGQIYERGRAPVNFDGILASRNAFQSFDMRSNGDTSLGIAFYNPDYNSVSLDHTVLDPLSDTFTAVQPMLFYSADWNDDVRLGFSFGASAAELLDSRSPANYADVFAMAPALRRRDSLLSGDLVSATATRTLSENFEVSLGATAARYDANPLAGRDRSVADKHQAYETVASLVYRSGKTTVRFKSTATMEAQTVLGSRSSGALKLGDGAATFTGTIEAARGLGKGRVLFGLVRHGLTLVDGAQGGFVADIGGIRTSSFALGLIDRGVFTENDFLGFAISQPLRVESGTVDLTLPTSRDYEADRLVFSDLGLSLAPTGREIDLELSYGGQTGGLRFETSIMVTRHQGHIRDTPIAANLILRGSTRF